MSFKEKLKAMNQKYQISAKLKEMNEREKARYQKGKRLTNDINEEIQKQLKKAGSEL